MELVDTTIRNSKGQIIEELDAPIIKLKQRAPFQSPKPIKKVLDEAEILAWCEYYLQSRKK